MIVLQCSKSLCLPFVSEWTSLTWTLRSVHLKKLFYVSFWFQKFRIYLHFTVQWFSTIEEIFHHFFGDWKIFREDFTALDEIWVATIKELRPEHNVVHPLVPFRNFRYATRQTNKDFLEVVKIIPTYFCVQQSWEAEEFWGLRLALVKPFFYLFKDISFLWYLVQQRDVKEAWQVFISL